MSAPPLPPDVDLRDFPYMPVDITRLFNSSFHARATDSEWRAGVTLWLKSFHQVPAASLPDDEIELARLAEFGRDTKGWRKVREAALRGWDSAEDGRLYHRVVAEKALEAWIEKLGQRKSSGTANAKRWKTEFDAAAVDAQIATAIVMLTAINPHSRVLRRRPPKTGDETPGGSPDGMPSGSQERGKGEGKGRDREKGAAPPLAGAGAGGAAPSLEFALREAAGLVGADAPALANTAPIEELITAGLSLADVVLPALRAVAASGRKGRSWAYYLDAIHDRKSAGAALPAGAGPQVSSVWVTADSPEAAAWEEHERRAGRAVKWLSGRGGIGRAMSSQWPPGWPPIAEAAE